MAVVACTGQPPTARWVRGTQFGGGDSTHDVGGGRRPLRAQGYHPFPQVAATVCAPGGCGRYVQYHPARCGHRRHHQRVLALLARACCSGHPTHARLAALPTLAATGYEAIFPQCNVLCFMGFFQLGNLKMSHI